MKPGINSRKFSFELGILMGMSHKEEGRAIQHVVESLLQSVNESCIDEDGIREGIHTELIFDYSSDELGQVIENIMADFLEGFC